MFFCTCVLCNILLYYGLTNRYISWPLCFPLYVYVDLLGSWTSLHRPNHKLLNCELGIYPAGFIFLFSFSFPFPFFSSSLLFIYLFIYWTCVFTNWYTYIFHHRFCVSCERLNLEAKYLRPCIDEKLGITNENSEVMYC